jgi:hypothetical protein
MGMGYSAAFAEVVNREWLAKDLPNCWNAFWEALTKLGEISDYASPEGVFDRLCQCWANDLKFFDDDEDSDDSDEITDDEMRVEHEPSIVVNDMNDEEKFAYQAVETAWDSLCAAFTEKHPGLSLSLGYHASDDDGDRYDDIDGGFIELDGAYVLHSSAEKIREGFERQFFVVFG